MKWRPYATGFGAVLMICELAACHFDFDPGKLSGTCDGKNDGDPCASGSCHAGACCTGCWDGTQCVKGDAPSTCGTSGADCSTCAAPTAVCDTGLCVAERAVTSIGAGTNHTCASDRLHTLWCWGGNDTGQAARPVSETVVSVPKAVSSGEWVEVAAGGTTSGHSCAIHFAGSVWCWGDNSSGQLGVTGAPLEPAPTLIDEKHWKHVTAGDAFSCAVDQGSTLWCWGAGGSGQLGFTGSAPTPTMVGVDADWSSLDAGGTHACAIKSDHSLWCWGDNSKGQLGRTGVSDRPGLVGTGYAQVSGGAAHTCAIRDDGTLWCWGDDSSGQLGLVSSVSVPTQVGSDADWSTLAAGRAHTCALKKDHTLWCWGDDTHGQLGDGNKKPGPIGVTLVQGRTDWKLLAAGADYGCAVTSAGLLFCWGAGDRYQTGQGVTADVPEPTSVTLAVN